MLCLGLYWHFIENYLALLQSVSLFSDGAVQHFKITAGKKLEETFQAMRNQITKTA